MKNLIETPAWKELEKLFSQAILECKDPSDINGDLKDETYSREVRARVLAADTMTGFIKKIRMSAKADKKEKISYR